MNEINAVVAPEDLVVHDERRYADDAGFLRFLPIVFENFLPGRIVQ